MNTVNRIYQNNLDTLNYILFMKIRLRSRFVLLELFKMFYNYCSETCNETWETYTTNQYIQRQEKHVTNLLTHIENSEIQHELRQLLLVEDYNITCDVIRKYNCEEYLSNPHIQEIIKFTMFKNEYKNGLHQLTH